MACENLKISFIGAGRMGEALIRGLIRSGADPSDLTAADEDQTKVKTLAKERKINAAVSNRAAVKGAEIVILAVKPKDIPGVLSEIREAIEEDALLISIAAGVNLDTLSSGLKPGARIVRVMPNAPAEKGAGIAAISGGNKATEADIDKVRDLFSSVGLTVEVEERMMNAATAVSGSGPAYFYLFVKALTDAGVKAGLDPATAYSLAHETMFGASRMLKYSKKTPEELIKGVRSPNGTTAAALDVFDRRGLESIIEEGIMAAVKRGEEIEHNAEKTEPAD